MTWGFSLWHERRVPDLREVDGEDGVRAAADVVHAGAGGGAVDVSSLHQLLHVAVVLHQVFGQIWDQGGRSEEVDSRTQHWQEVWWLVTRTFYVRSVLRVLPDSQVVGLSGFPPQQVSHSLVVDLQVAEGKKDQRTTCLQSRLYLISLCVRRSVKSGLTWLLYETRLRPIGSRRRFCWTNSHRTSGSDLHLPETTATGSDSDSSVSDPHSAIITFNSWCQYRSMHLLLCVSSPIN